MKKVEEERARGGQGFCCPHCADSKFPCVKMEKGMKSPEEDSYRETEKSLEK